MQEFFNISNLLSLSRAPLAFVYLFGNLEWKVAAVVLTALTDFLDGYLARTFNFTTKIGSYLDAIMDKFFVFCVAGYIVGQGWMQVIDFVFFISRDLFLLLLIAYLFATGVWRKVEVRAAWFGKFTTGLQLITLLVITFGYTLSSYLYLAFLIFGFCTMLELLFYMRQRGDL